MSKAVDMMHQSSRPSAVQLCYGQRTGNRACMECSRKKTKCDMTLPACSLCMKADSICLYPTKRKPRVPRHRKLPLNRSGQQKPSDKVGVYLSTPLFHDGIEPITISDHNSNRLGVGNDPEEIERSGQETTPSQDGTTSSVNDIRSSDTQDRNMDDLAYSDLGPEPSHELAPDQTCSAAEAQFANLGIPEISGEFGSTFVAADTTSSNGWLASLSPPLDGTAGGFDWMASDLSMFSYFPEYQRTRTPRLNLSKGSRSLTTHSVEATAEPAEPPHSNLELGIPARLVDELIETYFEKVHSFLPLFHKPRFVETYVSSKATGDGRYHSLSLEASLILHGMLALSARFSSSPRFKGIPPVQRGESFGERAKSIYGDSIRTLRKPTLQYLQGCILLAFYLYSFEPDSQGWLIIGMCSRLAYDLRLDKVDEGSPASTDQPKTASTNNEWSKREELRRAWWCIWELDTFASAISCRPPAIDRTKIQVRLPVSDQTWFADIPVDSAIIDPSPLRAWQTLRDCPNQDERAWFLLINFLLLIAHDLGQQRRPDPQQIEDIETAVACYTLLLPPQFQLSSGSIFFDSQNFRKSNWIISTNIMLQGCRSFIRFLGDVASTDISLTSTNQLLAPLAAGSQFGARSMDYSPFADQIFRVIRVWSPEYIPYNSPFIGCLILGPAAINLRVAKDLRKATAVQQHAVNNDNATLIECELLTLALTHIAKFWKVGSVLLKLANLIIEESRLPGPASPPYG